MAAEGKDCGDCTVCCTIMEVPALAKAAHTRCRHVLTTGGCGVYADRPNACRVFDCGYLQNPELGDEWRPDRAGFLMYFSDGAPRLNVVVHLEAENSWRREPYLSQLREWSRRDRGFVIEVVVRTGDELALIFPEGAVELGADRGLPIRSGYRLENGSPRPFAEFAEDTPAPPT